MIQIILFDQDLQRYRQDIYKKFIIELNKYQFELNIYYDKTLNKEKTDDCFIGIEFNYINFKKAVIVTRAEIIIQFVWMRYKFLLPFMIWAKLNRKKIIVWSHGVNLQNKNQLLKNLLYYSRQYIADALIIYTPDQKKFIKATHKKLFIANNTLDFSSLPKINLNEHELKTKHSCEGKIVILSVARFNVNNRKIRHLISLSKLLDNSFQVLIIGSGIAVDEINEMSTLNNLRYLGIIYDQKVICELYKLADIFIMPGAIGLAINQSFYFGTPVILEDVEQGPEGYYFENGVNGYLYKREDVCNLKDMVSRVLLEYDNLKKQTILTIKKKASFELMLDGFLRAIDYVNYKR